MLAVWQAGCISLQHWHSMPLNPTHQMRNAALPPASRQARGCALPIDQQAKLTPTCDAAYMDRNGDGWISASELSQALQDNGISVDAATIASLIAADFKGPQGSEPQISAAAFKVCQLCMPPHLACESCKLGSLWQMPRLCMVIFHDVVAAKRTFWQWGFVSWRDAREPLHYGSPRVTSCCRPRPCAMHIRANPCLHGAQYEQTRRRP